MSRARTTTAAFVALALAGALAAGAARGSDDLAILAWIAGTWALFLFALPAARRLAGPAARLHARHSGSAAIALALATCAAVYAVLLGDAIASGDAALYNTQVELGAYGERAIHWGYVVYGAAVAAALPLATDPAMNVASALAALLALGALALLVRRESVDATLVALLVVALGVSAVFLHNALFAEVYVVQAAAAWVALLLHRRGRPLASGVVYAYALTVSIAAIALAPLWLLPPLRPRAVLRGALAGTLAFGVFVAVHGESLLYGDRGLLTGGIWDVWADAAYLAEGVAASAEQLLLSFPLLFPLSLACIVQGLRTRAWPARWLVPCALALLLHAPLGGAGRQWGYDLIVMPLALLPLVVWAAERVRDPERRGDALAVSLLAVALSTTSTLALWLPRDHFTEPARYRTAYRVVAAEAGPEAVPLGKFELKGRYRRANGQPFAPPIPAFEAGRDVVWVVLDRPTLDDLVAAHGDRLEVRDVSRGDVAAWIVRERVP